MCSGAKSSPPQVCPGMEGWGQEEKKSCRLRPSPHLSATSTLSPPPPPPGPEGEGLAILLRPSPTATHKNVAWSVTYGPRSSPLPLRDRTAVGRSVASDFLIRGEGKVVPPRPSRSFALVLARTQPRGCNGRCSCSRRERFNNELQ